MQEQGDRIWLIPASRNWQEVVGSGPTMTRGGQTKPYAITLVIPQIPRDHPHHPC